MDPVHIAAIIEKQLQGMPLSEEEERILDNFQNYLQQRLDVAGTTLAYNAFRQATEAVQESRGRVYGKPEPRSRMSEADPTSQTSRMSRLSWMLRWGWAAAAAVLLLAVSVWLFYPHGNHRVVMENKVAAMDVQPGKQGAILTLGNGRQVVLDSMGNGVIARQSGTEVTLYNGRLTYSGKGLTADKEQGTEKEERSDKKQGADKQKVAEIVYNTMTTPKGRKFQLVLPDGTKVWLNAATTLRYPIAFTGKERNVSVTGEAYFEVAKDMSKPFMVSINNGSAIEVLGTSFNVNAYSDEASMKTTLLEGSVKVSRLNNNVLLKPGEMVVVVHSGAAVSGISVQKADIGKVMAWKNGLFDFEGASLVEVMKQLSRWYDIEVVYEKGIPPFEFGGKIGRDLTLASLLKFLEGAGVHFRIEEGRRLVVLP